MKLAYLNNTFLMAQLTESVDAIFLAGILPELRNTKKILSKNELKEKYSIDNYFFANEFSNYSA